MAIIGKIRKNSWLAVIFIGAGMLAFILLMDNSIVDLLFGTGPKEDVYGIGTVDGEKVNEEQYEQFANNARNNIMQSKAQQNPMETPQFTKADEDNATRQAWQTVVAQALVNKEYNKIGLVVDDYELDNVLYGENGYEPSAFSQQFTDSVTGEFAPDQFRMALNNLLESNDAQSVNQYHAIIDYIRETRLEEKYSSLLKSGIHSTTLEARREYEAKKTVKNVSYVYQSFAKVPNDAVSEPTEEDIKTYYDKHKNEQQYEQRASRKVDYFSIAIVPSHDDSLKAIDFLSELKPRFESEKRDSNFVLRFSDVKSFVNDSTAMARPEGAAQGGPTYPLSVAGFIENAEPGDVVGPYLSNEGAKLSKVLRFMQEKTATVRHILINAQSEEEFEAAQKKADSILGVIRKKHNFEEMVTSFSEDPGSVNNGGKYEKFTQGTMVQPFNDFSFQKPIGTIGTVKTNYGIHIVEVLDREETKRPILANIVKKIEPSKATVDQTSTLASNYIYDLFDKLAGKNITEQKEIFDTYAKDSGYHINSVTILDENPTVSNFSELVEQRFLRLAYDKDAKVGDINSSPIRDREQVIVAFLRDIIEKGTPRLDLIEDRIKAEVSKEKQAQYLIDKMVGNTDLNGLANELGAQFQTEGLTFSANNTAVGQELSLVGAAFSGLHDGETTIPIKGKNGVFVMKINETVPAEETEDFLEEKDQLKMQLQTSMLNQFQNALMKTADVVDNRKLRRYGIR